MLPILAAAASTLAPILAKKGIGLLAGIFKGATAKGVEKIAGLIEEKTGIDIKAAATDGLSDEQLEKLRAFEIEYQQLLLGHQEEMERARLADVKDARGMQVAALGQGDLFSKRFVYYLAAAVVILAFGFMFSVTFVPVPKENRQTVDMITGFLMGTALTSILGYFFGSSKSSSDKQEQMHALMKKMAE